MLSELRALGALRAVGALLASALLTIAVAALADGSTGASVTSRARHPPVTVKRHVPSRRAAGDQANVDAAAMPAASAGTNGGAGYVPSASVRLPTDRAIGQMLMSHVTRLTASAQLLARIRKGQVGSVILYGENISSDAQVMRLTESLQQAARDGGNPSLLIGTDQEGGSVKRLRHAPPYLSAQEMGASQDSRAVSKREGQATGEHLRRLGINVDFAPVSDIPTSAENFLGERAFGDSSRAVVQGATGFAEGLALSYVGASAKHFPGLGAAGALDTDFSTVSITASRSQLRAAYAPYRKMARLGSFVSPLVMISDAKYPTLDPSEAPAVLSRKIVRDELALADMSGHVTITDDLEVPAVREYSDAAVRAVLAGDDILMFAQHEGGSEDAYRAIRRAVAVGAISPALVTAASQRVIGLKQSLGLG